MSTYAQRQHRRRLEQMFYPGDFRETVKQVFAAFKRETKGIARLNYLCCGGCASSGIACEPRNHGKPAIFMHAQDQEGFTEGWLHVKFGWVHNAERDATEPFTKDDAEIGAILRRLAEAAGLWVEWDGTAAETVQLCPNAEVFAYYQWDTYQRYAVWLKEAEAQIPEGAEFVAQHQRDLADARKRQAKAEAQLRRVPRASWPERDITLWDASASVVLPEDGAATAAAWDASASAMLRGEGQVAS